jgi:hypothetical protein
MTMKKNFNLETCWVGMGWGAEYTSVRDLIFPLFMKFLNFNFNLSRERTVVSVHLIV